MTYPIKSPRKLIEVALPLDAINAACGREKSIRQGHPSALHLWWARRPLAAARAVIFAQLVNDPGYQQGGGFKYGKNKKEAAKERQRLFEIIEDLVLWENTTNEEVLERARAEIRRSWREVCELNKDHPQSTELFNPEKLPALHDPFAGGGAIPLEAQRLGIEAHASDLNPVAVLINKAMVEVPPRFAGWSPIGPLPSSDKGVRLDLPKVWLGATGLAEDVHRYGSWMREEAEKRIGHLYPKIVVTKEMAKGRRDLVPLVGQKVTVIAWIWARTVKSPNPAFSHVAVPLVSSFILSSKTGKEAYVQPVVTGDRYSFVMKLGTPPPEAVKGTKATGRGANFRCIVSNAVFDGRYIKDQAKSGQMGQRLMGVVAEGIRGRIYLDPTEEAEKISKQASPDWKPEVEFLQKALGFRVGNYGLTRWSDLFTQRQLAALTTFGDLVCEVRSRIHQDCLATGMTDGNIGLNAGGRDATAYAEAVSLYLAFAVDKMADLGNSLCGWEPIAQCPRHLFGKQAVPMLWDFAEANPLSNSSGSWEVSVGGVAKAMAKVFAQTQPWFRGSADQADAQTQTTSIGKFISCDPPYYDNIGYADLSDFFYVWLRRSLRQIYPELLATIGVPKEEELVATPIRHGGKDEAEAFFLAGMTSAMQNLVNLAHPEAPVTIYYAFKQSDTKDQLGTSSTGWVSFLGAVIQAGLQLSGTWPLRTENASRMRGQGSNALASSIILVCRKRPVDAATISRREFQRELNAVLPEALDEMTKGAGSDRSPVAPVDLSQAIIGPGMSVFSKYTAVLEADGSPMNVRTALQLINRFLAEDDFDHDTQFCLHWFEQYGWREGDFGEADVLARSKGTAVDGVKEAGVIQSGGGKVRLLKWAEYPDDWNPSSDERLPVWEALHQIIRAFRQGGDSASGALLAALGGKAEAVRQLAYRLYTLCERLGEAEDARAYNELITSWTGIETAAASATRLKPSQGNLDFDDKGQTL
jgi:putative DNA methylase